MSDDKYVVALDNCATATTGRVGGKALGLGLVKLLEFGLPVPPGFVLTAGA